jgi:hypothetical protein
MRADAHGVDDDRLSETGDQRLYDWCVDYIAWLDKHDKFRHGMASFQRKELEFNEDHVVAFGENVKHPALLYMADGLPEHLAATRNGIQQITDKCWQITGSPASNFEYLSPPSEIHETSTAISPVSELVLLDASHHWRGRLRRLHGAHSFQRRAGRAQKGRAGHRLQ